MVEQQAKTVRVSAIFETDISDVYVYGEETFGQKATKAFITDAYIRIYNLDMACLLYPECKYLKTNNKIYRNIILGSYLIIYRISANHIDVLRILRAECSIKRIRSTRSIKL